MSAAIDIIFGSEGKSSSGPGKADIQKAIDFLKETTGQAREDIFNYGNQAMGNRLLGAGGALDIFRQSIPEQSRLFGRGNRQAQATQASGLPQQINALLGLPTDFSGLQPKGLTPNMGFATNAQMPDFNMLFEDSLTNQGLQGNLGPYADTNLGPPIGRVV